MFFYIDSKVTPSRQLATELACKPAVLLAKEFKKANVTQVSHSHILKSWKQKQSKHSQRDEGLSPVLFTEHRVSDMTHATRERSSGVCLSYFSITVTGNFQSKEFIGFQRAGVHGYHGREYVTRQTGIGLSQQWRGNILTHTDETETMLGFRSILKSWDKKQSIETNFPLLPALGPT